MPRGLPFSVDTWTCSSRYKRHHFLTHAHKDHSLGISSNFSSSSSSPIYCTHITNILLLQHFPQLRDSLFATIEVGQRLVIDDPDGNFSVTAFDANHCPGAVMFLFEGNFGNILHTGDCRLSPDCLQNLPSKYLGKKGVEPKHRLHYVFLDCTFGKSSIKIPSKYSAVRQVINCIWKHPDAPVVYLSCDLLGQEEILVEVSRTFGSKIYVDKISSAEFYQALMVLAPDIVSDDASLRFQVFVGFPKLYERAKAKLMEARANSEKEPLFIRPSTQWYACEEDSTDIEWQRKQRFNVAHKDPIGVWHVCYSMHSSREELEWALQLLQPKRVVSTTPSCRAMELDYVKNQCFSSLVASDDPLWKLLDINTEVAATSPKVSASTESATVGVCPSQVEHSTPAFVEDNSLPHKNLSASNIEPSNVIARNTLEIRLKLSPSKRLAPITLFGKARHCINDSTFLLKDTTATKIDTPQASSIRSENDEPVSIREDTLVEEVLSERLEAEKNNEVIESASCCSVSVSIQEDAIVEVVQSERLEAEKKNEVVESVSSCSFSVGSTKGFSENMRMLYRSMNIPVPRPLPSLVELMNNTKRARKSFQL